MSQSPTDLEEVDASYVNAWKAINRLIRRGWSWSGHERNCAFLNVGDGSFARIDAVSGFGFYDDARGVARIDWDLDGDLDLFVTNRNGPHVRLLRNDLPASEAFVTFLLKGTTSNRDAIGARVEVHLADGRSLVRSRRAGEGYLAQSSSWVHFGLPANATIEKVIVRWPGGAEEEFDEIATGRRWVLAQWSGEARRWDPPIGETLLAPSPVTPPLATGRSRVVLPQPLPMVRLAVESLGGEKTSIWGLNPGGRPTPTMRPIFLTMWSRTCAPCFEDLTAFAARKADFDREDLALFAMGVDAPEEREAAAAMLERTEWPWPVHYAADPTIDVLDALQGLLLDRDTPIRLPASFLVDREGHLISLYFGRVDPDVVLADLALLTAGPQERLAAASPFRGEWARVPAGVDLAQLEARFTSRGLHESAREVRDARTEMFQSDRAEMLHDFGRRAGRQGRLAEAIRYLQEAVREDPARRDAWGDLGVALHLAGQSRRAVDAYDQALLIDPRHAPTRLNLGLALVASGERVRAEVELKRLRDAGAREAATLAAAIAKLDEGDD